MAASGWPNSHVRPRATSQSGGPDEKQDLPSRMEPPVFIMVDGEFSGPHFRKHAVLAWSLVAFRKALTVGDAVVPEGSITVHMSMPRGASMDPATQRDFFDRNPGLLEGLRKGALEPADAMARVAAFLSRFSRVQFVSKPASIDIGRLAHMLSTYGPAGCPLPDHTSVCLKTQLHMLQSVTGMAYDAFHSMLRGERVKQGVKAEPSHHPLDDCMCQISDFLLVDRMVTSLRSRLAAPAWGHSAGSGASSPPEGVMFTPIYTRPPLPRGSRHPKCP